MLVIPRTKHIASRIFDFPLPLRPVIELKLSSQPLMTVRTAYDLKPSTTSSIILILAVVINCDRKRRLNLEKRGCCKQTISPMRLGGKILISQPFADTPPAEHFFASDLLGMHLRLLS